MRRLLLLVLAGFALVEVTPMWHSGGAFVGSDEAVAYLTVRSVAEKGSPVYDVPFGDWAHGAFSPLTTYTPVAQARFGVASSFAWMYAPASAFGPSGVLLLAAAMGVLLVVGVHLTAAELFGRTAGVLAAAIAASAPPLLFFAGTFYTNVTGLAFFFLGTAAAARALVRRRAAWLVPAALLLTLAVSMRRDGVVLVLPLLAAVAAVAWRRPRAWPILAAGVAAAAVAWVLANRVDLNRIDPGEGLLDVLLALPSHVAATWELTWLAVRETHPALSWEAFAVNSRDHVLAASPLVVGAGALLALGAPRLRRRPALMLSSLLVVTLVYCAFYLTWDRRGTLDPPGLNSSLVRYTMLVPLTLAVLAGAALARAVDAHPPERRKALVLLLVACFALPGLAHATFAEPGLLWMHRQREWRSTFAEDALGLPEDAVIVGDEPSVFVFSHPVLVPVYAGTPAVTRFVDRMAELGRPSYVHMDTYEGDWSGMVGDHVADRSHYATQSGVGGFLEIRRTNTTLGNVGILRSGHWREDAEGRLESVMPYSYAQPTPSFAKSLWAPPSPGVLVTLTFLDDDRDWHQAGYVNAPLGPNDAAVLHRWLGSGSGEWRTERFFVPADTVVNGPFFVSEGLTFSELRIEPLPGVVVR